MRVWMVAISSFGSGGHDGGGRRPAALPGQPRTGERETPPLFEADVHWLALLWPERSPFGKKPVGGDEAASG